MRGHGTQNLPPLSGISLPAAPGLVALRGRWQLAGGSSLTYTPPTTFEQNEARSDACFSERGFDFSYAARAFFDPDRLIQADTRRSYGEER